MTTQPLNEPVFLSGQCHVLFAFDVGLEIALDPCRRNIASFAKEARFAQNRRAPKYFDYDPAPLLLVQEISPVPFGSFSTHAAVEFALFDFGGVAIEYTLPFECTLSNLELLSCQLSEDDTLREDARRRVQQLTGLIRPWIKKPQLSDMVEDYVIFQVENITPAMLISALPGPLAASLSRILRAQDQDLSEQERHDACATTLAFGTNDLALIDWNAAILFDRDADDVRAVLSFANLELLELRVMDRQLDISLDQSYEELSHDSAWRKLWPGSGNAGMKRVAQMQLDGAILFERVSNAPKLMGDQYLARVYRMTAQRFHLPEWDAAILRKLDVIGNIYKQMHERAASARLEILEWIIILLILFEIVMAFVPERYGGSRKDVPSPVPATLSALGN